MNTTDQSRAFADYLTGHRPDPQPAPDPARGNVVPAEGTNPRPRVDLERAAFLNYLTRSDLSGRP